MKTLSAAASPSRFFAAALVLLAVFATGDLQAQARRAGAGGNAGSSATSTSAQLAALMEKVELQGRQIETLNEELTRLGALVATLSAPKPAPVATPAPSPAATAVATPALPVQASPAAPVVATVPPAPRATPTPPAFTAEGLAIYYIKKGDTLTLIARQHGTTVEELLQANPNVDEHKLQIGKGLALPKGASATPIAPTPEGSQPPAAPQVP